MMPRTPEPDQLFHLTAAGELQPATALEPALPAEVSGLPAFYYWKDAIVVGSYVHPNRRFSLNITRDRLDGFVANFQRMTTNGVAVPILMDHAPTASATLGWIVAVKRDGDRLMELHQFLGESARDIGLRNKVSLGIDPHFIDGKGTSYGEAIVHSAVTPVPVVPNQGEFEPVTLCDDREDVIALSLVDHDHSKPIPSAPGRKEPGRVGPVEAQVQIDAPGNTGVTHPGSDHVSERADDRADNPHLAAAALEQVAMMKRDLALSRGAIDAAVADELFELLVRPGEGGASPLLLARTSTGPSIAIAVFDALSRNRPVPLGETTALQVLSRITPGDEPSDLRERMIALASGR